MNIKIINLYLFNLYIDYFCFSILLIIFLINNLRQSRIENLDGKKKKNKL